LREALEHAGAPAETALWAMIETPAGVLNVSEIAAAAAGTRHPLAVLVLGTNDLAKEARVEADAARTPLLPWLSQCVLAARAHGLDVLDGVYNDLHDAEGFARECAQGRMLGMDGKTLIHPGQITAANTSFSPSAAEIDWAR
jgi:citrate lyase subunit beta/citryl-CoA lyase